MFTELIVRPIFNLLAFIYAIVPGHNFGLAIILFTIVVRLALWPLVRKQLRHARAMRELQPEIKKIKAAAKGDRKKESQMTMELYKEREISPFSSIGIILIQLPILYGLFMGLSKIIKDPGQMVTFSYGFIQDLGWLRTLEASPHLFDETLFGFIDLTRKGYDNGVIYWPVIILALASAIAQYYQSKQILPKSEDSRGLRSILKDAGEGKPADNQEVSDAVGRMVIFIIPIFVFWTGIHFASALVLYWFVGALVAIIQQTILLRQEETELAGKANLTSEEKKDATQGGSDLLDGQENVDTPLKTTKKKKKGGNKKRRKR